MTSLRRHHFDALRPLSRRLVPRLLKVAREETEDSERIQKTVMIEIIE
jgi:hypothetical protein